MTVCGTCGRCSDVLLGCMSFGSALEIAGQLFPSAVRIEVREVERQRVVVDPLEVVRQVFPASLGQWLASVGIYDELSVCECLPEEQVHFVDN